MSAGPGSNDPEGGVMSEPSIEITERRLELADMTVGLQAIYSYWDDKRDSAPMPARADVDPLDFGRMLGSVTLMEVNPGLPRFVYRVWGTRMGRRRGGGRDGMDLAELRPRNYAEMVIRHYEEAVAAAGPTLYRNVLAFSGATYTYERLLLPLGADRRTVDRLLVCPLVNEVAQRELWRRWEEADERIGGAVA
jgi:hypothetical protein